MSLPRKNCFPSVLNSCSSTQAEYLQIGKELFLAEGRLKLRLIGLRVTKLKDLRTSLSTGIKRVRAFHFFLAQNPILTHMDLVL